MFTDKKALVIFSGGQDSATCLAWALQHFANVQTLGFAYGQRHEIEMACRIPLREQIAAIDTHWQGKLGADTVIDTNFFQYIESNALTADVPIAQNEGGVPSTFVPGRNLLFLNMAAAFAYGQGIEHLVMGVCEADSSGYPDCQDDAIKAMQVALNIGMDTKIRVHAPLMWITKCQTWELAEALGGKALVDIIVEQSHTCYTGQRQTRHIWGYGCDACPACILRKAGYKEYMHQCTI